MFEQRDNSDLEDDVEHVAVLDDILCSVAHALALEHLSAGLSVASIGQCPRANRVALYRYVARQQRSCLLEVIVFSIS